jgi:PEP-CTERM motif
MQKPNRTTLSVNNIYSGSLLNPLDYNEKGVIYDGAVYTGTDVSGIATNPSLGYRVPVITIGSSASTSGGWLNNNVELSSPAYHPLYALSQELTVPSAVPEPSTYALLCISLGVVGYARRKMVKREG